MDTRAFIVRRPHASSVAVLKRGYTQLSDGRGGMAISWGLVLLNRSHRTVKGLQIDVNFLDAAGNVLIQDGGRGEQIGPNAKLYVADQEYTHGLPLRIAEVETVIRGGHSTSRSLVAPAVTNVKLSADAQGSAVVEGDVTNHATTELAGNTGIAAVLFNSTGNVIGGAVGSTSSPLPPGAQTAFKIDTGVGGPPASQVSRAGVSVYPAYSHP